MQEFDFTGPLRIGDEKQHKITIQVTAVPDDPTNVELVKQCGAFEQESVDVIRLNLMIRDKVIREYLSDKTDTIDTGEAN